ncbi:hypothetical protein BC940DRAFT_335049 [Gongronella butleri]|nr:hypothetical protein BC940DRAFT_335049 [Gongronella butleri]
MKRQRSLEEADFVNVLKQKHKPDIERQQQAGKGKVTRLVPLWTHLFCSFFASKCVVFAAKSTFAMMMAAAARKPVAELEPTDGKVCRRCICVLVGEEILEHCAFCEHEMCLRCLNACQSCEALFCSACAIIDYSTPMEQVYCTTCFSLKH